MFSLRSLVLLFPPTLISVSIFKVSDASINASHLTLNTQCSKTPYPESLQHETSKHVPQMLLPHINREPNLAPKAQLFETRPAKSPGLRTTSGSPLLVIFHLSTQSSQEEKSPSAITFPSITVAVIKKSMAIPGSGADK